MRQRKFEEILDECVSAYLEGRRSVDESLSLYPSLARRLDPLLRAAADTADAFQDLRPTGRARERIRQRILRAAAERAAARALTRQIHGFGAATRRPLAGWAILSAAGVAVTGLFIAAGILLPDAMSGGSGELF